jgi:hypothetical protein
MLNSPFPNDAESPRVTKRRLQTNTNGTFVRVVNGEKKGEPFHSSVNIIVTWSLPSVSRIFYKDKYDASKPAASPKCWSNMGDKPEKETPDPQHPNCADCENNIKGSGAGSSRACRYMRRLAVLIEGDTSGDVYQFNVPAKSLFGKGKGNVHPFESYLSYLRSNGEHPDNVVTKVCYSPNSNAIELLFTPLRNVSEEEWQLVKTAQDLPDIKRYTQVVAYSVAEQSPFAETQGFTFS